MRRVLVLFAFAGSGPACTSAAVSVPVSVPATPPAPGSPAVAAPRAPTSSLRPGPTVRACRATPGTVYGNEAVVFDIDATAAPLPAEVELFDHQGRSLSKAQLAVPGQWRPPPLASGDFRLQAGSNRVTCWVTVNRDLSRDRAAGQK
jgi:hypothetical protein